MPTAYDCLRMLLGIWCGGAHGLGSRDVSRRTCCDGRSDAAISELIGSSPALLLQWTAHVGVFR